MPAGLFITGTGTGVGKTYVAALIARALRSAGKRVGVYKPVASGCEERGGRLISPDAVCLWLAAGGPGAVEQVCPQKFRAPLAPHLAARAEGQRVEPQLLRDGLQYWRESCDIVLVEGAGGLMSPISDDEYNADLAAEFGLPLVVVAANALGTINATLQTLITASSYRDGLHVAGIVLNRPDDSIHDPSVESNHRELSQRCIPPLLADVAYGGGLDVEIDWYSLSDELPPPRDLAGR
jgi:dethiobiotin synthetase